MKVKFMSLCHVIFTGYYMTFNATREPYVQVMSNGTFIFVKRKEERKEKKKKETLHTIYLHQKIPSDQRCVNPAVGLCCYRLGTEVSIKTNTSGY